jgi:hypothetical protein
MGSIGVVVAKEVLEIAPQARVARNHRASESWLPAFLEYRALEPLHAPVGLGTAAADEAMLGAQLL